MFMSASSAYASSRMSAVLLVPPTEEPLSLTDAKQFLRVDHDDHDAVIAALIAAARHHVEALTRKALLTQTWRLVRDAWPGDGRVSPRIGPLQSLLAVRVFDAAGFAAELDLERFVVDVAAQRIAAPCWSLPVPGRGTAGIQLDVICGYGYTATDVPPDLRHALRMLVAHWYDNRGLTASVGAAPMLPAGIGALLAPHRLVSL